MATESGEVSLHVRARLTRPGGRFAVDVEFVAPPGVTILFGPSGSGKSTTLAIVSGLVRPTAGRIAIGGDTWFDADENIDVVAHRRQVAFVFQSLALFPHMTAAQNVTYGMDRSIPRDKRREQGVAWLERLKVPHLVDRRPGSFSGGEAQRVALARALATKPRVVLLDEPFSALDRDLRRELASDLRGFVRDLGVPVVVVTHERQDALALGDRLVHMDQGRVVGTGHIGEWEADARGSR